MLLILTFLAGCAVGGHADMNGESPEGIVTAATEREPSTATAPAPAARGRAVFSWQAEALDDGERERFMDTLALWEIDTVYQWFSRSLSEPEITAYTDALIQNGYRVFALTGDPSWAEETDAASLLAVIEDNLARPGVSGIVLDVEPARDAEDTDALMTQYLENMLLAYSRASKAGLTVIVCIPVNWDAWAGLPTLIEKGCDGVAVMNYFRGEELEYLEREAAFCRRYGKALIQISELQPPGEYGLKSRNTYYEAGMPALLSAWDRINEALGYEKLSFAFHNYDWLSKMSHNETEGGAHAGISQ